MAAKSVLIIYTGGTIGMVNDMYAEYSNDGADYAVLAGQEDFDLF